MAGVQPAGVRDKRASVDSEQGAEWRNLNRFFVFYAAQLHGHSRLICRLEAKN